MVACSARICACQHVGAFSLSRDEPLGFLLYRVMASLRPQVTAELKPLGLGLPEFVCMRILAKHPWIYQCRVGPRYQRFGAGGQPSPARTRGPGCAEPPGLRPLRPAGRCRPG